MSLGLSLQPLPRGQSVSTPSLPNGCRFWSKSKRARFSTSGRSWTWPDQRVTVRRVGPRSTLPWMKFAGVSTRTAFLLPKQCAKRCDLRPAKLDTKASRSPMLSMGSSQETKAGHRQKDRLWSMQSGRWPRPRINQGPRKALSADNWFVNPGAARRGTFTAKVKSSPARLPMATQASLFCCRIGGWRSPCPHY